VLHQHVIAASGASSPSLLGKSRAGHALYYHQPGVTAAMPFYLGFGGMQKMIQEVLPETRL